MAAILTTLALFLSLLITFSSAQSTSVTSFFLLNTDPQPLVASVIAANPAAATFYLTCPPGTDQNDCGYSPGITLIAPAPAPAPAAASSSPPSSAVWQAHQSTSDFHFTYSCDVTGTTSASCSESYGGSAANFPGATTETFSGAGEVRFFPVTITAGLERLGAVSASATPSPPPSSSSSSSSSADDEAGVNGGSASATTGRGSGSQGVIPTSTGAASGTASSSTAASTAAAASAAQSTGAASPLQRVKAGSVVGMVCVLLGLGVA
ncbi:hypothetical protein LTS18_004975 [Coniosporium uncinatum]|uniref:Uncharacterized protein n=1 Tax=Coniosporium uncinatum TaxID=93489 RepID=A0ACC3DRM6_9PEZI|nr:hypothetical protein LTS18_004975 [Coniosporium uncinatum]